jgi:hypothetical protein
MNMPYVTSVERLAKAEGAADVLIRQLRRVCGPLPEEIERRVRSLSYPGLEALSEALLGFRSLEELGAWLDAHVSESAD